MQVTERKDTGTKRKEVRRVMCDEAHDAGAQRWFWWQRGVTRCRGKNRSEEPKMSFGEHAKCTRFAQQPQQSRPREATDPVMLDGRKECNQAERVVLAMPRTSRPHWIIVSMLGESYTAVPSSRPEASNSAKVNEPEQETVTSALGA
jgi:hypothetical protein